jgi:hypothetical protein
MSFTIGNNLTEDIEIEESENLEYYISNLRFYNRKLDNNEKEILQNYV